ncbi:MAG: glycosyltransferase family 4 protein [Thermodesulfobacteriota bacterium]
MKLAFIRQQYTDFGGAERYISQLVSRLLDLGHEVHVLARRWRARPRPGLTIHRVRCLGGPAFVRLPSFARQAADMVKAGAYDLVHGFDRTYLQDIYRAGDGCHREFLIRRTRAAGRGQALLDALNPKHRVLLRLEAKLFADPRLKLVLANSEQGRREIMRHYGLPESMIRVVYNGLDQVAFRPSPGQEHRRAVRSELRLPLDEPAALFVGSGFARKGLAETIQALPATNIRLLVAGRDRSRPYRRLARRLGVEGRVVFLGPRLDVARLYGAADVFVLPSWYEPFSNACLEAMASGLPVVTTRETGVAEIIQEGVNGFLVTFPVDPAEVAEKLKLALNLNHGRLLEANARALKPFDWEENLARTLAAYEEITGRP